MKISNQLVQTIHLLYIGICCSASVPSWRTRPLTTDIQTLLERNLNWSTSTNKLSPNFLHNLALKQSPKIMWIGCSDSRVPETKIFGAEPGEFFVHRSIANIVHQNDLGLISAVEYAVKELQVEHVIVCGHYKCGGVQAAMKPTLPDLEMVSRWIDPIKDLYKSHNNELKVLEYDEAYRSLVRINVHRSVQEILQLSFVREAMNSTERTAKLRIHPWVYDLEDGLIDIMEDGNVEIGSGSWYTNFGSDIQKKPAH